MNFMIKSIAAKVISHLFGEYIDQIDSSQLGLEIWNGKARMENLKITKNALSSHNLPFIVNNGTVGSISLVFPWGRLSSEPCIVNIDDVYIVASVSTDIIIYNDFKTKQDVEKLHKEEAPVSEGGTFTSIISQIIDNLQFHIKNVHIRIELNDSIVALGVTVSSIKAYSVNEVLDYAFVPQDSPILRKKVEISDLSIYIDPDQKPIPTDNFSDYMQKLIYFSHHYVLRPFNFSCHIYMHRQINSENSENKENNENFVEVIAGTQTINLALDELQLKALLELEREYAKLNTRRKFSHCGKPDEYPQTDNLCYKWWHYSHRCAIVKKNKISFEPKDALNILANRKKYVELVELGDDAAVKTFEKQFDLPIVVFLRNYANGIKEDSKAGIKLLPEEIEAVIEVQKKTKSQMLDFIFKTDLLSISFLSKDMSPIARLLVNKIKTKCRKYDFNSQIELSIKNMTVFNEMSKKFNKTLTSNGGTKITIKSSIDQPKCISFEASGITFVVDLQFFNQIIEFFANERKNIVINEDSESNSKAKKQIQTVIDQYQGIDLNICIENTSIVFPYQKCEDCTLVSLFCQKTNIISIPTAKLDVNDFSTLYDKYIIKFEDSMLYLDGNPLLFNKFNCNIDLNLAIAESNMFDKIQIICLFDRINARISTIQFLVVENFILYIVDAIFYLFLDETEKLALNSDSNESPEDTKLIKYEKNLQLKKELMKSDNNISKILFVLKIEQIDFSLCLQSTKIFEILTNKFELNCFIDKFFLLQVSLKNLTGYEFITYSEKNDDFENNKFAYVEQFKFDFTNKNDETRKELINKINIDINNPMIYAKRKCLLYLIELLTDPNSFEKVIDNNESFDISKIQYQMIVPSYSYFEIDLNINNVLVYLSNDSLNIGEIIIKNIQILASIVNTWSVDFNLVDFLLKNKNQLIEIMGKTTLKANNNLIQMQRVNPIIIMLNFDYIMDVFDYVCNLTLPKENVKEENVDSYYTMRNIEIDLKSIIGSFNELNFNINDICLKGKTPIQLDFNLGLIDITLDKTSLFNIQNVSVLTKNKLIDHSLIHDLDNIEGNILDVHKLLESKSLPKQRYVVYSSIIDANIESIKFVIIPQIMNILPCIEKVSKIMQKYSNNSKTINTPKHNENTTALQEYKPINIISFGLDSFSFAFYEEQKSILSLNLHQIQYKDNIIKLNSFSILSEGNDPIAICKENFFCCSDSLTFIKVQDTDFVLDYDLFLSLTKSLMQYLPIFSYMQLFQSENTTQKEICKNECENSNDNNNDNDNKEHENKFKEVDATLNKFTFLIKDKEANICLTIAFSASENHFEINQLAINFIMDKLTLPILQPVSIKYDFNSESKNLTISPINFVIVIGIIKHITSLSQKYLLLFNNQQTITHQKNNSTSNNKSSIVSSLPHNLQISPITMNIKLCFNDRTPLVTFGIETSKILISQVFSLQLQLSIVYFNPETGNNDLILEPLNLTTKLSLSENDKSIDIATSPIILNIHIPFIKRLIYFNHYRMKQIKLNHLIYKFVNKMQNNISIKVGDVLHENIKSGQSVPFNDVDLNTPITIEYDSIHVEKFVLNQLFYPTALSSTCFIYRENNRIYICPPFFIENNLDIPITVYSSNLTKINKIKSHDRIPLPTTIDIKQGLYFVYGELETQNIFGGNLATSKAISIGSILNCSNETSIENMLAKRSPVNSIMPNLYKLGSWFLSEPIIYDVLDSTVDENNKNYVAFIYQRLEKEFIGIIEIAPILIMVNELPFDLKLYTKGFNSEFSIKSGHSIPFPFNTANYNTENTIECQFEVESHGDSAQTVISYKDNSKTEIILKNSVDNKTTSFTVHAVLISGQTKLYIYSPAILCNRCGFRLNYRRLPESKPLTLYDYTLLPSQTFVQNSTLNIQIQCEQFHSDWQKEKIDCTTVAISSTIFLPTSNESIFVPIHVHNHKAASPYHHTTIIDLSPALVFINETTHRFVLNPSTDDKQFWQKVYPNSHIQIAYSTKMSQFYVQMHGIEKSIKIILASPMRQVFRFNNIYIEMEIVLISGSLCCFFRDAKIPSPIVFTNLLKNSYRIYQTDSENPIVVEPNSTSLFAYDEPFGDNSVVIDFGSEKIKVPLNSNCEPTEIKETGFFIEIKTAGKDHRMLIISETNIAVNYDTSFHFSLSIQDIMVSLINQYMTELCLISFHNLCFKTSNEGPNSLYELILDSFQIDDQLSIAPFSTFLIGDSNEKAKFLHCSAICYRDSPLFTSFKNFTFSMQKLQIFADMAFMSDMYGFFKEIKKSYDKVKNKQIKLDYGNDYTQVQSTLLLIQNEDDVKTEEHIDQLISFSSLTLHPFLATVTYRGLSGRPTVMPKLELLPALMIIPNITNANLSLKSFQIQNFLASISMLRDNIFDGYKNQLIMESWRIAGHSDIFFNVFGIAETFGNGFKSMFYDPIMADVESPEKILLVIKGGGQLIFGTLGSIIKGGEGFIKNISNFLSMMDDEDANHAPTDNTNLNAVDTFTEGVSSLGNGLIDGISGLIKKPIEGGKKDGIFGAVTGLAKGAIGAVTKPAAGLLDMSAGIIGGIRKTISISDGSINRFREPNSYPFSIVGGFDLEISKMQSYAQKLNKKKKFYLMKLMAINIDNNFAYALFDKRMFFFKNTQKGFEFYSKLNIVKIQNISREGKTVQFKILGKNKTIKFDCMNQEMAEKFIIVLNSLVTFAGIFN